jgi:hypothetical protein
VTPPLSLEERRRTKLAILAYRRGRRRLRLALYVIGVTVVISAVAAAIKLWGWP